MRNNIVMPIEMDRVEDARRNIAGVAVRTPLVRSYVEAPAEIYLKLENLQPIGSFKIRGAANVMTLTPRARLERGVLTASAGNMAQGVAFCARRLGVPATVVMPDTAPATKIRAVERLGGRVIQVPLPNGGVLSRRARSLEWTRHSSTHSTISTSWRGTGPSRSNCWKTCPIWTRWLFPGAVAGCPVASRPFARTRAASANLRGRSGNGRAAGGIARGGRAADGGLHAIVCGWHRQQNGIREHVRARAQAARWIAGGDAG